MPIAEAVKEQVIAPDTMRALQFFADTPGKDFGGDVGKLIEWMMMVVKRNEPWFRFQEDLFAQSERTRGQARAGQE